MTGYRINNTWWTEGDLRLHYDRFRKVFGPCMNSHPFFSFQMYVTALCANDYIKEIRNDLTVIDFLKSNQFTKAIVCYRNTHPEKSLLECKHMVEKIQSDIEYYKERRRYFWSYWIWTKIFVAIIVSILKQMWKSL